ncbi:MAG: nuclear transport factor 2 family protein [Pirellulales bacterium]
MRGVEVHGAELRRRRKELGLTQESLAHSAQCDIKTIRNAEGGRRLDASTVKRIADVVELPLRAIIVEEEISQRVAERNAQLFHDWQAASNRRDVEAMLELYQDDAVVVIPGANDLPGGGEHRGKEAIGRQWHEAFEAFLTEELTPDRYKLDAVGDYVFARGTATAVVRATGQSFTGMAIHELQIQDGKILRHTIVVDTTDMRRCLSPAPDSQ